MLLSIIRWLSAFLCRSSGLLVLHLGFLVWDYWRWRSNGLLTSIALCAHDCFLPPMCELPFFIVRIFWSFCSLCNAHCFFCIAFLCGICELTRSYLFCYLLAAPIPLLGHISIFLFIVECSYPFWRLMDKPARLNVLWYVWFWSIVVPPICLF